MAGYIDGIWRWVQNVLRLVFAKQWFSEVERRQGSATTNYYLLNILFFGARMLLARHLSFKKI